MPRIRHNDFEESHGSRFDWISQRLYWKLILARQTPETDSRSKKSECRDIEDLFPRYVLTITHGTVIRGGNSPSYCVNTIAGRSGSPIVVNGKVVGIAHS